MKKKKIIHIIVIIFGISIALFCLMFLLINQNLKNNSSIYCIMEDDSKENKMEIYYDFKDGQVYRYSIVNTNKLTNKINIEAYKEMIQNTNNQYKGSTGKFWNDNNVYMTIETYDLELLTEEEFKEITGMSLKELKSKTRQQIIDSIIPMSNGGSFKCN